MIEINNKKLCENCFSEVSGNVCQKCGYTSGSAVTDHAVLPLGTRLNNRIIVGRVIGKGGFGITYIGYDIRMDKIIALKEYYPNEIVYRSHTGTEILLKDPNTEEIFTNEAEKFYSEAQMVSRFNGNPNIVSVYDYFRENNTVYLVMEMIDGITLKNYIKKYGTLSDGQALYIMNKMAEALSVTHSADVLHRDISPENIMLCTNGNIKLIDFGAARQILAGGSSDLTVVLKPGYTPIEQYTKKGVQGGWTDIYSLGASIYYALTDVVLDDPYERMEEDKEFSINKYNINEDLWEILKKCTMINSKDRYKSAIELKNALTEITEFLSPESIIIDPKDVNIGSENSGISGSERSVSDIPPIYNGLKEIPNSVPIIENDYDPYTDNYNPYGDENDRDPYGDDRHSGKKKNKIIMMICSIAAVAAIAAVGIIIVSNGSDKDISTVSTEYGSTNNTHDTITEDRMSAYGTVNGDPTNNTFDPSIYTDIITIELSEDPEIEPPRMLQEPFDESETVQTTAVTTEETTTMTTTTTTAAKEMTKVPAMLNKPCDEAQQLLKDAGLGCKIEYADDARVENDCVFKQSYRSGSKVEKGTVITIYVSIHIEEETVPPVTTTTPPKTTTAPPKTTTAPPKTTTAPPKTTAETTRKTTTEQVVERSKDTLTLEIDGEKEIFYQDHILSDADTYFQVHYYSYDNKGKVKYRFRIYLNIMPKKGTYSITESAYRHYSDGSVKFDGPDDYSSDRRGGDNEKEIGQIIISDVKNSSGGKTYSGTISITLTKKYDSKQTFTLDDVPFSFTWDE